MPNSAKRSNSNQGIGASEMVVLDGATLKQNALKNCQHIFQQIQKVQRQIIQYNKEQKPAYDKWLNYHFGEIIQTINQLAEEIREKRRIISEVQEELYYFNISLNDAYDKVKRRMEEGYFSEDIYQNKERVNYNFYEVTDEDDVMGEELNEFFSKMGIDEENKKKKSKYMELKEKKFKERYHYLASKLHPDKKGKELTEEEKELWNEIQIAYKNNDDKTLEGLFARYKVSVGDINQSSSLFDLRMSEKKLSISLRKLKEKRRLIKKTEAWGFTKLNNKKLFALQSKKAKDLKELEHSLMSEKKKIQEIISLMSARNEDSIKKNKDEKDDQEFIEMYLNF
jgi:hypothetical protein